MMLERCQSQDMTNECVRQTIIQTRSVKLVTLFKMATDVDNIVKNLSDIKSWTTQEGDTMLYFEKLELMQELADDPSVETICEIGFNLGKSALNFLLANPRARLVSFDLFGHHYPGAAVRALHHLFPDRDITLIAGDSAISVPTFARLTKGAVSCNLIFIDGGHKPHELLADLQNMKSLANQTYHKILIDDLMSTELADVWSNEVSGGHIREIDRRFPRITPCVRMGPSADGNRYVFDLENRSCVPEKNRDKLNYNDTVTVGEYLW